MSIQAMTDKLTSIESAIEELRHESYSLREQIKEAKMADAKARAVFDQFKAGRYVVRGASRPWWCQDGELLSPLSSDDLDGLFRLRDDGVIIMETKILEVTP